MKTEKRKDIVFNERLDRFLEHLAWLFGALGFVCLLLAFLSIGKVIMPNVEMIFIGFAWVFILGILCCYGVHCRYSGHGSFSGCGD